MRGRGRGSKRKRYDLQLEQIGYQYESVGSQEHTLGNAKQRAKMRGRRARSRGALVLRGWRSKAHAFSLQDEDFEANQYEEQSINLEEEASSVTQEKGPLNSKAFSTDFATVNIHQRSKFPANSGNVKLIRNSELFLKEEEKSLDNVLEATAERVYLPDTRDINKSLLKERLLQEITSVQVFTGITPSLQREGKKMFFLIKHQDHAALEEAKQMIAKLVKNITAELKSMKDLTTSHNRNEHTDVHPSEEAAATVDNFDRAPLEASHEDFLAVMNTGGPERNDKPVYGFITNIPRGQSAKAVHSIMEGRYRKVSQYAGPAFSFLSMFKYSDRSLDVKFCALKFPSRKILQQVINTCNPIVTKKVRAFITEVPPADENLKDMTSQIRAVLLASAFLQKSKHTSTSRKNHLDDTNAPACVPVAPPLLPANRPCGVFPGGVQPEKVVMVVDDATPHLRLEELRNKGYDILTGSNLDVHGFLQLITGNDHYRDDGVLYVVQPGLDFFLKNMKVIDLEMFESKVDSEVLRADEDILGLQSSFLMDNFRKSVRFGKIHSHEDIFNFSDDDLAALSKFNLSLPNFKIIPSPTTTAPSSKINFITSKLTQNTNLSASNECPPIEEAPSYKVKGCAYPSESEEQDSKSREASCKVHEAGSLQNFVTRTLQQALALRNSVLINTLNSEVVFLGYPVECLFADHAQQDFPKIPEPSLEHLAGSLIASLHLFNVFAAKTWKLGGFPSLNFNNDPAISSNDCVLETKKPGIKCDPEPIVVADHDSEEVEELTSKKFEDKSTTAAMKTKIGHGEDLSEVTLNYSVETIIFDEGDDDDDITSRVESTSTKPKAGGLRDSLLTVGSSKTLQTGVEVIDFDVEDQELYLYELDSEGDAVKSVDMNDIEAVSTETVPPTWSNDFLDLSLLKKLCVVKRDVTADVVKVLDLVSEHYKVKGSFPPWTTIEGEAEAFNPHGKSSILREYVQSEFFKGEHNSRGEAVYQCAYPCNSLTYYTADEAEAHVYTRPHTAKMNALAKKKKQDQARHLLEHVKEHGTPVVQDQIKKLIKFGILEQLKIKGLKYFSCLLCPNISTTFDGVSLRSHLQEYAHLKNLVRSLGIEGFFTMHAIENWRTFKRALRYSTMDVIILADDMHRPALRPFTDVHSRVHVITVPGLIRRKEGWEEALHLGHLALEWRDVALTEPQSALWLIVTGMDLLVQPAHLVAAISALAAPSSDGGSSSAPTAEQIIEEEMVLEQELFDEDINALESSKNFAGVPSSTETAANKAGERAKLGVETVLLKDNSAMVKDPQAINWTTVIDNLNETIKKSVTLLVKLHSFFRVQLPPNTKVLVAPLLPLAILPDTAPQHALVRVMQHKHAVITPPRMAQAVARAYASLSEQVYSIHSQNSTHENMFSVNKTILGSDVEVGKKRHSVVSSLWHVAVEEIILNALHGMPAVIPNLTADDKVNVMKLGLRTSGWKGVIVGESPYLNISPMRKDCGVSVIPFTLKDFNNEDMDAIISAAKRRKDSFECVWYLSCPFPQILFQSKDCEMCVDLGCSQGLKLWSPLYDVPQNQIDDSALRRVSRNALIRVSNFITLLQSKLPPNNFVTLFPIFPSTVISVDCVEKNSHRMMHSLEDDFPCTFFSLQPVAEVMPIINWFRQGWLALFQKISLGHILDADHRSFMQVKARHINNVRRFLAGTIPRAVRYWHEAVESLLVHHYVVVQLSKEQMQLLGRAALKEDEKNGLSSIAVSVIPDLESSDTQQIDCRDFLNQRRKEVPKEPSFSLTRDRQTDCISGMAAHNPRHSAQRHRSCTPRFRSCSPDLESEGLGFRETSYEFRTVSPSLRSPGFGEKSHHLTARSLDLRAKSPPFREISLDFKERSPGPSARSPCARTRNPQLGGSAIRRTSFHCLDYPPPLQPSPSTPSMRSPHPHMSTRTNIRERNSPTFGTDSPVFGASCPSFSSSFHQSRSTQLKHKSSSPGSRNLSFGKHLNDLPDEYPDCNDRSYSTSSRTHLSQEKCGRNSESVRYSPRRPFPGDYSPDSIICAQGRITGSYRERSSWLEKSRLSLGLRHSGRDHFSPSPKRRRITSDHRTISPDHRPRLSPDRRPRLSPDRRPRLSPDRRPRLSPDRHPRLSLDRHTRLSPDRRSRLSPDCRSRLSPDRRSRLSPDRRSRLSPDCRSRLSPDRRSRLSPDRRFRSSPDRRPRLSPNRCPRLSPDRRPRLSPSRHQRESPDLVCVSPGPHRRPYSQEAKSYECVPTPGPASQQLAVSIATASQEPLSQQLIKKIAWSFKISAEPSPGPKGSWHLLVPSAQVLFGVQRFLPAVRLLDHQLIVTLESSNSTVVPVTSLEEEEQYKERLEYVVRCYNQERAPKLVNLLLNFNQHHRDTTATFFRPSWQHLYTRDLSRSLPLVADAMRSLAHLPPSEVGSVRLVVVTPSANAVQFMMMVLKALAASLRMEVVAIVSGTEETGPGMTVVVGAAVALAKVCPGLLLQDLAALVVDDATLFLDDPTFRKALLTLLSRMGNKTRSYASVNKVVVARHDNATERSRMEEMLECRFARAETRSSLQPRPGEDGGRSDVKLLQHHPTLQRKTQVHSGQQEQPFPPPQQHFQNDLLAHQGQQRPTS